MENTTDLLDIVLEYLWNCLDSIFQNNVQGSPRKKYRVEPLLRTAKIIQRKGLTAIRYFEKEIFVSYDTYVSHSCHPSMAQHKYNGILLMTSYFGHTVLHVDIWMEFQRMVER